jgi:hypothetical protein
MKLTNHEWLRTGRWMGLLSTVMFLMVTSLGSVAYAAVSTTTIQGTVYLANGEPATGTVAVSWPSFTTASGELVAADSITVPIATDGFLSINLAPNQGATPAGQYYTATYYLSDGTTSTEYWVVPAAAQATLGAIQAQVMPAAQAVQAVSKAYVDQAIAELSEGLLTLSGATMTGPLYLNADPTQALQAADKHYVDAEFSLAVPLTGAAMTGPLTSVQIGALYQVDQFSGADFGAKLAACLSGLSSTNGGTCDARNFTGTQSMGSNLTISTGNATVLLPCATISTANQVIVTAGTRNVTLRGCALRGASTASGSQGGTVFLYSGTNAMLQVGDSTYAADTPGFHLDNVVINTTASSSATAQGFVAYRTQELDLESLYFLGNSNQTGMTLDGTGNYTGGTFIDNAFIGFQTAVNAIGHQIANSATTDWMNASTFIRLHIDCPTSGGNPISGSYGINLQQGDGNTFTGGDVEGCATALHLGANAQNNTIVGLRNENSTNQVVADAGSAYNDWMTGGTMFTGQLTDNGTRNSFLDAFHRSFNGLNGDWYGSQKDATVTNHFRIGIGTGNERGLLSRYQTDYGYRWTMGLSDATAGEQFYQIQDELNNVYRLSIGQYNNGQSSTNNQTVINAAGSGAIVLNGSNNSGTGGVVFGSGGASETTVATINNAGNAQFNGTLQVGGTSTFLGSTTVKNQVDAEIDQFLWAGLSASQKESFTYKDYDGSSQWYMVKDKSNNWALNSAVGGLNSFKAYQSTNSGDTYINASNTSGAVRINYEPGAGAGFYVYGGGLSSPLYASFTGATAIRFPGLESSSGHNCLQIDNSGYVTNTGSSCGSSSSGTISSGSTGQIAYYTATGTAIGGMSTVPLIAGGTGATTAAGAVSNLIPGAALSGSGSSQVVSLPGSVAANSTYSATSPVANALWYGADPTGATDSSTAINAAAAATQYGVARNVYLPAGVYHIASPITIGSTSSSATGQCLVGDGFNTILDVSTDFSPSASGVVTLAGYVSDPGVQLCVKDLTIRFHQPADIMTTTTQATSTGSSTITVSGATGILVGDYVVDATNYGAISNYNVDASTPLTTVTNIAGNVLTLSNAVLSPGVSSGDTVEFAQPKANFATLTSGCSLTAGSAGCKYPWAIYNNGAQTAHFDHVLIEGAWDGLYQRGQTYHINDLYVGALDQGINQDNSLNFPQIDNYEMWSFGNGNGVNAQNHLAFVENYYDGNTVCANLGRSDGLAAGKIQCWIGSVNLTSNWTYGQFDHLMMDGTSANFAASGVSWGFAQIANFYSMAGQGSITTPIQVSGGNVYMSNAYTATSAARALTAGNMLVTGGSLHIYGGIINANENVSIPDAVVTGGTLEIDNTEMQSGKKYLYPSTPWIAQSGTGILKFEHNHFIAGGSSAAVSIGVDNLFNKVSDNVWNGWTFQPTGSLGSYGPNSVGGTQTYYNPVKIYGALNNANGTVIPSTAASYLGSASGGPVLSSNTYGCVDGYNHLPCVVAQVTLTGVTATISSTPLFTLSSSQAGLYRMTYSGRTTTVGTAGTWAAGVIWNDGAGTSAQVSGSLTNGYWQGTTLVSPVAASSTVSYYLTFTSPAGFPAMEMAATLERIH